MHSYLFAGTSCRTTITTPCDCCCPLISDCFHPLSDCWRLFSIYMEKSDGRCLNTSKCLISSAKTGKTTKHPMINYLTNQPTKHSVDEIGISKLKMNRGSTMFRWDKRLVLGGLGWPWVAWVAWVALGGDPGWWPWILSRWHTSSWDEMHKGCSHSLQVVHRLSQVASTMVSPKPLKKGSFYNWSHHKRNTSSFK